MSIKTNFLTVVASTGALNFCFFFGGASCFGATTTDATSGAGAMDSSLFIHQGIKERDDNKEEE